MNLQQHIHGAAQLEAQVGPSCVAITVTELLPDGPSCPSDATFFVFPGLDSQGPRRTPLELARQLRASLDRAIAEAEQTEEVAP